MNEPRQLPPRMPEILPRIRLSEIKADEKPRVSAPFLKELISVINALGAFDGGDRSIRDIAQLMYTNDDPDRRSLNATPPQGKFDRTCEERLYRIMGGTLLIEREIQFFRRCLGRIFGNENVAHLDDMEIFSNRPSTMIQKLFSEIPPVALGNIDPLLALIALALTEEDPIEIELRPHGQQSNRSIVSRRYPPEKYEYERGEADIRKLIGGYQFRIFVPKVASKIKPLAVSFSLSAGKHVAKDGTHQIDTRGQVLTNVQPTDDETGPIIRENAGPWRIAEDRNKPFEINKATGRSGILVISDVGQHWERFFPDDCDQHALCNDDYRYLYSELANLAAIGNAPKLGVLLYEVE